jgi:hypothetical protein
MKAPDWYEAWCEEAFAAFSAKQQALEATYRLGSWHRYDYDTAAAALTFSDEAGVRVRAEIQVLGTIDAEGWVWNWASPDWPTASVLQARAVAAFGVEHGIEELTTGYLKSDDLDGMGWMLAAIATRVLGAQGAYRAPHGDGAVYLLIQSIRFVS